MKVEKLNNWFEKFGRFEIKHRWAFITALLIVTIICSIGLTRINLVNSETDWFDDWETVKMNQNHFEEIFGSSDSVMCHITVDKSKAPDGVFDPECLEMIDRLGDALLQSVPYANSVTSIMELKLPIGKEDGFEVASPFEDGVPDDPAVLKEKRDFIISRDSIVNNLVSKDCSETWLIINLEHYSEVLEDAMNKIVPPAMKIFNSPEFQNEKWTLRPAGSSYTEYEEDKVSIEQCISHIGIGFIVMLICLIIFIRSFRGVIVPALATVFALTTTLGGSAWLGIDAQTLMLIVTALLSMALAVGYAVHYVNNVKLHFRKTGNRNESVILAVKDSGWPLLFTVITTMGGMLSFLAAGIRPMRWVGVITAIAVFLVFVYTIILLPCFYSFGKDQTPDPEYISTEGSTKADFRLERMGKAILNKKWVSVILGALVIIASIPGALKMRVDLDYFGMMGERTPYIKRLREITRSQLGSYNSYEVLIEYDEPDAFKNPDVLRKMDELTQRIGTLRKTKVSNGRPRVSSVTSIVKEMNRALNGDDKAAYAIPDDEALVSQLMFLYEISGGTNLYDYVNTEFNAAYLHVELTDYDAELCIADVNDVNTWAKELFPDAKTAKVAGQFLQYAAMNEKLVRGSIKSIGTSFLVIFILLCIAFMSIKTGLIAMIPNIAPILLIAGFMGYANVPLDIVTAMIMPMILGIAVDDTIHFTNHIKYHFEECGNYRQAILNSYREIGKSMIMTTVILCAMFFIFNFSTLTALVRIGYLSILGLSTAILCDYTLTPVLMYIFKPFGKEKDYAEQQQ